MLFPFLAGTRGSGAFACFFQSSPRSGLGKQQLPTVSRCPFSFSTTELSAGKRRDCRLPRRKRLEDGDRPQPLPARLLATARPWLFAQSPIKETEKRKGKERKSERRSAELLWTDRRDIRLAAHLSFLLQQFRGSLDSTSVSQDTRLPSGAAASTSHQPPFVHLVLSSSPLLPTKYVQCTFDLLDSPSSISSSTTERSSSLGNRFAVGQGLWWMRRGLLEITLPSQGW